MPFRPDSVASRSPYRTAGLIFGPAVAMALAAWGPPDELSQVAWWTAAIGIWMAIWWMTEALPLAITALLPLLVFPLLGIRDLPSTATSYAHPIIMLFLGGFVLARSMSVWGLDRRLALSVLHRAGSNPRRMIGAIMMVTAFLSMWISNTATAMVMLPIGLSVALAFQDGESDADQLPSKALLLGIAYAATIGGMGTLIGTPPNALFAAFMQASYGLEIGFGWWMLIGVPVVLVLLPLAWWLLTSVLYRIKNDCSASISAAIENEYSARTVMSSAQRKLSLLLILVAVCWVSRPLLENLIPAIPLSDAGIALTGALLLFIIPAGSSDNRFLLHWKQAIGIRWGVLILFGGGLALATAMGDTGLAEWIGSRLAALQALPLFLLLLAIGTVVVFVGELASNTAMAAVLLPVAASTAQTMGEPVLYLVLPVTLFATLGFMLPVATPPNAIVFGSGQLELRDMLRAGAVLDIVGIFVVALAALVLVNVMFGQ